MVEQLNSLNVTQLPCNGEIKAKFHKHYPKDRNPKLKKMTGICASPLNM